MSKIDSREGGLGDEFPGRGAQFLLRLLLPSGRREEFVGDLIEEAETVVLPQRGRRAARRWFWWQAATSASPMHVRRCAREVGMNRQRWIIVAAILVLGPLMALDGGINTAPGAVIGLVAVAIAIPAAAGLLSGNLRVHAAAALLSTALLIVARLSSGSELRWYAIPWIFYILLYANWLYEHRIVSSGDGGGQATPSGV
jgi:hypothetical protein